MRLAKFSDALEEAVREARSERETLETIAAFTGSYFLCDRVVIAFQGAQELLLFSWGAMPSPAGEAVSPLEFENDVLKFQGKSTQAPLYISDVARFSPPVPFTEYLKTAAVRSYSLTPITYTAGPIGWIECYHKREFHLWRREEQTFLNILAARIPLLLRDKEPSSQTEPETKTGQTQTKNLVPRSAGQVYYEKLSEVQSEYRRLLEYGNFVLFKTNPDFAIIDVQGATEPLLGVRPMEILEDSDIWSKFLPTKARLLFMQKVRHAKKAREELYEEFKIVHKKSGEEHWILFHGVPLFSDSNELIGWEALGLDITDKKNAEEALLQEKKRLQALYEVSHASQLYAEPEIIALRTLTALKNATRSVAAMVALYDDEADSFELVAADGLTEDEVTDFAALVNTAGIFRSVLRSRAGSLVPDLQKNTKQKGGKSINLKAAIVMPLVSEGEFRGICCLARKTGRSYSHEDFSLVQAACNHIARRIKQAQFHLEEKKAADSVAVLYRLSHELLKYLTPHEVAERAVSIISEELPCKRLWLGIMNEQRTHIAGHAGYGPGLRRQIVQLQLELDLRHDHFDEAIQSKKPVVVQHGQKMNCSGLEKLLKNLALQSFVIVPLVSLGQVVGVLLVEPTIPSLFYAEGRIALLMNVASEIGTVLLARRFEAKMADNEKMKMAGLLASGVSHNFNNLLQAVMGYASLIQLQSAPGSKTADSATRIIEAAGKGAALVNQLMTVSSVNTFSRRSLVINEWFRESRDFYKSVLGPEISLELDLEEGVPNVLADSSQLQQIMANILLNAKEAIDGRHDGFVKIQTRWVRLRSGEMTGDIAPGTYLRIDIQDNGKGMSEEVQARCFEPFFTTKAKDPQTGVGVGASGLGLSSVQSVLRQHSGYITVRSREGTGSVFTLFLPLLQVASDKTKAAHQKASPPPDVVVFGSDEAVTSVVTLSLDAFNLKSRVSRDSEELKEYLKKRKKDTAEMLVIDLDDPKFEPEELSGLLKKHIHTTRCILLSRDLEKWAEFAGKFEHVEMVRKPLGTWNMPAAISELLARQGKRKDGVRPLTGRPRRRRSKKENASASHDVK